MARRKSQTSATGANMDSLLDALTNVVGILVIVLVANAAESLNKSLFKPS